MKKLVVPTAYGLTCVFALFVMAGATYTTDTPRTFFLRTSIIVFAVSTWSLLQDLKKVGEKFFAWALPGTLLRELPALTLAWTAMIIQNELAVPLAARPAGFRNSNDDAIGYVLFWTPLFGIFTLLTAIPFLLVIRYLVFLNIDPDAFPPESEPSE